MNHNEYKFGNSNACSLVGRPQKGTRTWRRHAEPLIFERWFLIGIRKMKKKEADFTFLCPGLVRIQWPDNLQSCERWQISREKYETEYLSKF